MVVGAIAPNAHEGSRSEYLAQYVFASFGAAVALPHQEDSGIDLHCDGASRPTCLATLLLFRPGQEHDGRVGFQGRCAVAH
jgi:hypothetical protein